MIRLLVSKQWHEIFRSYHYNAKKNKARSKAGIIGYYIFFAIIMVGLLGGIFTGLSISLCAPLNTVGLDWLYFVIMGGIAILLGALGSVFNTYSGLYLAKDNDLLFSLPISLDTIMFSRLMTVYLMGLMYSAIVFIPALLVYCLSGLFTWKVLFGSLIMLLDVSAAVMVLSCVLGYIVANLSLKIKNKGIVSALAAVIFIGVYYLLCFKSSDLIRALLTNAEYYGTKIKGASYALYLFGAMGTGNPKALLVCTLVIAALAGITWVILRSSFLRIATSPGAVKKTVYREKRAKQKSLAGALLQKELGRFTYSANYMLNCGLGLLILPIAGVALLIMGERMVNTLASMFALGSENAAVLLCAALCMAGTMIDPAAPAVSLEGKNLWIARSLPISAWEALRAKLQMQLALAGVPMLFCTLCAAFVFAQFRTSLLSLVLLILFPLIFTVFMSLWGLFWGVKMPNLNWSSEIYPIKQSMAVTLSLFGGWLFSLVFGGLYLWQGYKIGCTAYLAISTVAFTLISLALLFWLKTKGAARFEEL